MKRLLAKKTICIPCTGWITGCVQLFSINATDFIQCPYAYASHNSRVHAFGASSSLQSHFFLLSMTSSWTRGMQRAWGHLSELCELTYKNLDKILTC